MRWIVYGAMAAAALASFGLASGREVLVNVSPLARVVVHGANRLLNPDAPSPERFLDVLGDGFVDDQYVARLPSSSDGVVELQFPRSVTIDRLMIIGAAGGNQGLVTVVGLRDGREAWRAATPWTAPADRPPVATIVPEGPASALRFEFHVGGATVVNSIQCFALVPRWKAWAWFLGLQVFLPWIGGGLWALAVVGWGRLGGRAFPALDTGANEWSAKGRRLIVGLTAMALASSVWFFLPEPFQLQWGPALHVGLFAPAILALRRPTAEGVRWGVTLSAAALLLLTTVAVESTIVANRRVKPMDHLFGSMAAEHLLARERVPDEMVLRPWLVPALAAPTVSTCERLAYWMYLGQMAWMNVLGVGAIACFATRFGVSATMAAAFIALLPLTTAYHFSGQRVLVAGLSLLAIGEWLWRDRPRWILWGGWAASVAVMAHPGALFVLPPVAVYFAWKTRGRERWAGWLSVGIALGAYGAWSAFAHWYGPEVRNALAYYPIMRTLDDAPPREPLSTILAGMSAEHWAQLGWNRIAQLRHYLWADNPWQSALYERLHPISLTSALGVALTVVLVLNARRLVAEAAFWVGVAGPLLLFHLHMGQAFPQFHILPVPFFALAVLGIGLLRRHARWVLWVVVGEALLHQLFVPAVVFAEGAGDFELPGWFAGDPAVKWLALAPVLAWMVLADVCLRERDVIKSERGGLQEAD